MRRIDSRQMTKAELIAALNAVPDAPPRNARRWVTTRSSSRCSRSRPEISAIVVEIRVHDNGTGIAPEIKDKLFQPFFTTKPTGEGTGLGLSISYDIVTQQHGGTIEVDSRVGEFTEFVIRLPRTHRAIMAEVAP